MRFITFQFRNSHRFYAVDVMRLHRVEERIPYYALPWSRREILGLCRLNDWVIPVMDMRPFLDDENGGIGNAMLFTMTNDGLIAFAVGHILALFGKSDIQKVIKHSDRKVPYLLHTRKGVFHLIDIRVILKGNVQQLWSS